jgi:glycosyltransferase involved in cell wall biosynthesis
MKNKVSIIIPAHNEEKYLNKTIQNFYDMSEGEIEIIVVLNGYEQEVDRRAIVFKYKDNMGERIAMNTAASIATGEYLFRIDAHCSISNGWDTKLKKEMTEKKILVSVITAIDKDYDLIPGHWYGFCKLLPSMEEKWINLKHYKTVEKNMAFTGCGFMISKKFYDSFGGADENLPQMGAIGPEFALRGWLEGDGCYTHTGVTIGHVFSTG